MVHLLGLYARVVDHLVVRNVAQGALLGGGSTLHPNKKSNKIGLCIFVQSDGISLNAVPSFYEFITSLMPAIVRFISSSLM